MREMAAFDTSLRQVLMTYVLGLNPYNLSTIQRECFKGERRPTGDLEKRKAQ